MVQFLLKSGVSLDLLVYCIDYVIILLEFLVRASYKLFILARNVDPKTSFSGDGTSALDLKANAVLRCRRGREVDVVANHIWRSRICERQTIDLQCSRWTSHDLIED
jgi:hypothetical protein